MSYRPLTACDPQALMITLMQRVQQNGRTPLNYTVPLSNPLPLSPCVVLSGYLRSSCPS